jgi:hypothetical protein
MKLFLINVIEYKYQFYYKKLKTKHNKNAPFLIIQKLNMVTLFFNSCPKTHSISRIFYNADKRLTFSKILSSLISIQICDVKNKLYEFVKFLLNLVAAIDAS